MLKINRICFIAFLLCFLSCKKSNTSVAASGNNSVTLSGSKWCIYQYKDANTSTPQLRSDTLIFINASTYKYNNQTLNYNLIIGDNSHLTLGQTPFGDIDGTVPNNFIQNAEIIDVPFSQLKASEGLTYYLWIKKI
jgi:hypothetical protein